MKTIGLIGGMSWESSLEYYRIINTYVNEQLGGYHSCKSIMLSVDFDEVEKLQHRGDWNALDQLMAQSAVQLEKAGAGMVILCTNTMHLCSDAIRKAVNIPFLHIAEATGKAIAEKGLKKVGLLGTKFTMEKDFYKNVLRDQFGIEVVIPVEKDRNCVHNIIYKELVHGVFKDASRELYRNIIKHLEREGAEGVILGCTEIPLLISPADVDIPVFDTTRIHAEAAVNLALKGAD